MLGETNIIRSEGRHLPKREGSDSLSNRQLQALTLMACGFRCSKIARLMGISDKTVGTHVDKTVEKLLAENRIHAVLTAVRKGTIPTEVIVADSDLSKLKSLTAVEDKVRKTLIEDEGAQVNTHEAAFKLGISVKTIEAHLTSIYKKLQLDRGSMFCLLRLSVLTFLEEQRQSQ